MKLKKRVAAFPLLIILFTVRAVYSQLPSQLPMPGANFHYAGDNGGWTWYNEPKAVYYEGVHKRTYFGWISNTNSDVYVASFDHETNKTVTHIMAGKYGADDHNHPAIIVRPDGRILVFYTGHSSSTRVSVAISKNPEDISVFASDSQVISSTEKFCYPNAVFLSNEGTVGRFYTMFRNIYNMPCWTHSDDWGKTWSPIKQFFYSINAPESHRPYVKYCSNGKDEIHMVIEAWHRRYNPPVYYMKYKGGRFYKENNVQVGDTNDLPIQNSKMDTLWNATKTGRTMTCWDVALDSSGAPVFVADIFRNSSSNTDWTLNHIYYYYRWNGTAWFNKRLLNSGQSMGGEAGFGAGLTLDHENTNIVYIARQYIVLRDSLNYASITDSTHEIEKWMTRDRGVTWDTFPITRGSVKKNTRPCVPRGHKAGGKFELMWMYGNYTSLGGGGYPDRINFYPYDSTTTEAYSPGLRSGQPSALSINRNGIAVTLDNPAVSALRVYDLGGRLVADFTSAVRRLKAGAGLIDWKDAAGASGSYVVELDNGVRRETRFFCRAP